MFSLPFRFSLIEILLDRVAVVTSHLCLSKTPCRAKCALERDGVKDTNSPGFCSQRKDTGFSHETVAIGGLKREATPVSAQLLPWTITVLHRIQAARRS